MSLMFNKSDINPATGGLSPKGWIKLTIIVILLVIGVSVVVLFMYDVNTGTEDYNAVETSITGSLVDSKAKFRKQYETKIQAQVDESREDSTSPADGDGSGLPSTTKGGGKLITDPQKNPYKVPLYDGLTMDAEALGCESYAIPYEQNPFPKIQECCQAGKYIITCENRRCEGGSASWNWYDEVNYSPSAKCGEILPYTEVDGRISIAVPWRWSTNPSTYPLNQPAGNKSGDAGDVGIYYDVVFSDGSVLACIGGSAKGIENDTNTTYQGYMHYQACPIEIVQYTDLPVGKPWSDGYAYAINMCNQNGIPNDGKYGPSWTTLLGRGLGIKEVVVYRVQHYRPEQGYKNWFTGD